MCSLYDPRIILAIENIERFQCSLKLQLSFHKVVTIILQVIAPPKSHWRAQHQDFINNIRAAKGAQVAMERGDPLPPPPPPALNPGTVKTPSNQTSTYSPNVFF